MGLELPSCELCERVADLSDGAVVARTNGWICYVNASFEDPACVVQAVPHVVGLWSMTDSQSSSFGPTVADVARAMQIAFGAERVYLVSMGEAHAHLHSLLLSRTSVDPIDERGVNRITRYLNSKTAPNHDRAERMAARIREWLDL
jgi:diadenosine tetraphosphate (Ap4A) HIT family hydrolase